MEIITYLLWRIKVSIVEDIMSNLPLNQNLMKRKIMAQISKICLLLSNQNQPKNKLQRKKLLKKKLPQKKRNKTKSKPRRKSKGKLRRRKLQLKRLKKKNCLIHLKRQPRKKSKKKEESWQSKPKWLRKLPAKNLLQRKTLKVQMMLSRASA